MASHNVSPVREQIRAEIRAALADGAARSATELYGLCPSATESTEIAKIAHDMRRTGQLDIGEQVIHPLGMRVHAYRLPTPTDPRIEAAKPIKMEPTIKKNRQPAQKRKPPADHPFQASIRPQEAHDGAPRVTRPLPMHLTTSAPQMAAESINHHILETAMSEDPLQYIPDPDAFTLEPKEPEAEEDIDSDLVDALLELAHLEPKDQGVDDVLAMASADVGEIAAAMGKPREWTGPEFHLTEDLAPKKVCQCLRINALPPLPKGYIYGGIKVWIESEHDVGRLTIATHDEGGGAFASIKASGRLSFDPGELVAIGQVADALMKLHQDMSHE